MTKTKLVSTEVEHGGQWVVVVAEVQPDKLGWEISRILSVKDYETGEEVRLSSFETDEWTNIIERLLVNATRP